MKARFYTFLIILAGVLTPLTQLAQPDAYIRHIRAMDATETVLGQQVSVRPDMRLLSYELLPTGEQLLAGEYRYKFSNSLAYRFFVAKLDAASNPIWVQSRDIEYFTVAAFPKTILPNADGGNWVLYPGIEGQFILTRLDAQGNTIAQTYWDETGRFQPVTALSGANNDLFILRRVHESTGSRSTRVLHLDANGNSLSEWSLAIDPGENPTYLDKIVQTDDGGIILGGTQIDYTSSHFPSLPVLIKLDANGTQLWAYTYEDQGSFAPINLMADGNGCKMVLRGSFDQVMVSVDGTGAPTDIQIQQTDAFEPEEHAPAASRFAGQNFLTLSPASAVPGGVMDGQWVLSQWDEQGALAWSYFQAPFIDSIEWVGPVGIGLNTDGSVQYAGEGFIVPQGREHYKSIFLAKFSPQTAGTNDCAGSPISWNTISGTLNRTASPWNVQPVTSPPLLTASFGFTPDTLYTLDICVGNNNGGGQTAALLASPVSIGPNPVISLAEVTVSAPLGEVEMRITDPSGRVFLQETHNIEAAGSMPLNMSKMESGVYLLTLTGRNFTWREKIIKSE